MINKPALFAAMLLFIPILVFATPVGESEEGAIGLGYGGQIDNAGVNPICGDPYVTGAEQCDGSNLNGQSCTSLGFTGGTLSCSSCSFNTSLCTSGGSSPPGGSSPSGGSSYIPSGTSTPSTPVCPVCPVSGAWSECIDGARTRTSFTCSSTTKYICTPYNETNYCTDSREDDARAAIDSAITVIEYARAEGKDVSDADVLLSQAQDAFSTKDFETAIYLASQASTSASNAAVPIQIEGFLWIIIASAMAGIMAFIIFVPSLIYKELEHSDMISHRHVGKKVMFKGYLDPVKKYSGSRMAYRIAHDSRPYAAYSKLLAMGSELCIVPDVRYAIYGRIHKLSDGGFYMQIHKVKPFLSK